MKLWLDTSKAYAIALEGGGAKGAYEVGVWKALDEAGVRFDAVAGTSVGALNGAMMVMGELEQALRLWENIRFSQVFDADDEQLKKLYDHKLSEVDFRTLFKDVMEAIHEGGLDIEPLRRLIAEWVDEEKIRASEKKLFLVTYSLTDKRELDMDADELEEGKLRDMLLASAYVPLFQRKKLDGKDYVDGSVHNIVPISSLLERGYRDIIVIRIFGVGFEKRTRIPEDANIINGSKKTFEISTRAEFVYKLSAAADADDYKRNLRYDEDLYGLQDFLDACSDARDDCTVALTKDSKGKIVRICAIAG